MSEFSFGNPDARHERDLNTVIWGGVTDPANHNPDEFRYLVYAIQPYARQNALIMTAASLRDDIVHDRSHGDQGISLYDQPERLNERVSHSLSLIDQSHLATWGEAGLIVEAPEHNVIITSRTDAGVYNGNIDALMRQAAKNDVVDGDSLLKATHSYMLNEVVALARRDGCEPTLKGFFFKTSPNGEPHNPRLTSRMKEHAVRLGLPVVAIVERGRYAVDMVETLEGKMTVCLGGRMYMLDGYEDRWQFRAVDVRNVERFASPDEIKAALSYAIESGAMTEEHARMVTTKYEAADAERQTPKVVFDNDGQVEQIFFNEGYGTAERQVTLDAYGGHRVNLAMQAMVSEAVLLGGSYTNISLPISPTESEEIVERACESLGEADAAKVRQWSADHKPTLEARWQSTRIGHLRFGLGLPWMGIDLPDINPQ